MHQWIRDWLFEHRIIDSQISPWTSFIVLICILLLAGVLYGICRFALAGAANRIFARSKSAWGEALVKYQLVRRLLGIVPAIFVFAMLPLAFSEEDLAQTLPQPAAQTTVASDSAAHTPTLAAAAQSAQKEAARLQVGELTSGAFWLDLLRRLCVVYVIAVCVRFVNAAMSAGYEIVARNTARRNKPLKVFVQVMQMAMIFAGLILIVSIMVRREPTFLFAGLGASAAVLMLVFKDSILGLVAGIQLSANDMLRVGDWITMPKYNADGDVIEVSLSAVKVRNFDNTITTIPPYALVSDSFQNWRGMSESGGRRIKRSLSIDMNSVKFCSPRMLEKFGKIALLRDYLQKKQSELEAYNREHRIDDSIRVNGRRQTNLGVFRAYIEQYLRAHPLVHRGLTCMVRQRQPTEKGIPLELYFFSSDTRWIPYENIQSDVFDHIIASVPEFELRVYQNLSGSDVLEAAKILRALPPNAD